MPSARLHAYSPKHSQLIALGMILFVSGFCSLVYQVVWLREFRLIFGGATPAASAVLAVFMGGLGIGGAVLGRRVEKARSPGRFYAIIELGIAVTAALTPFVLALVRHLYIQSGGIQAMGLTVATLVQIGMTALVLGLPCFLMGGTLPAALKFGQSDADERRAMTAAFYGVNVAGAVSGAFIATFFMLGAGGNFLTLMTAAFLNLLISLLALALLKTPADAASLATAGPEASSATEPAAYLASPVRATPARFVSLAAFASGFVFFLIELVWFRMSIPLFGGSVFNFGIILAVALAGIGAGSLLYSYVLRHLRPSLLGFSVVSSLFAFAIILPFALGDSLAYASVLLNNFFQARSFWESVLGWSIISMVMVFPAAFFAGIQFPLLISLLGKGNPGIGAQLGRTYGWNTAGAVLGSLLGGFWMIPALSLPGCWRFCGAAAVGVAVLALILAVAQRGGSAAHRLASGKVLASLTLASVTLMLVFASDGPSAYWQHNPIGYGRARSFSGESYFLVRDEMQRKNRDIVRAYDGREASVALTATPEYAILTNGKSDSAALSDAPTTVMLGLTGAALHVGKLERVGVVGMGTGVTVGWLTQVADVGHIDVMELETSTWELSKFFKAVNFDAPNHPKVSLLQGDARELLLTRGPAYNLIVSEPSNIHRAGVANLYTREFYQSAASRMTPDALFCQWVQAYEIEPGSLHLVVATLRSVFPKIELWQTCNSDLLLVCAMNREPWNGASLAAKLRSEPFATALRRYWGTATLEGFLAHCLANQTHAEAMAMELPVLNTDAMNILELSFGQSLGTNSGGVLPAIWNKANASRACLPAVTGCQLDVKQWAREQLWRQFVCNEPICLPASPDASRPWDAALLAEEKQVQAVKANKVLPLGLAGAATTAARMIRVHRLATASDPAFPEAVKAIENDWPTEAVLFRGLHAFKSNDFRAAACLIVEGIHMTQQNPWVRITILAEAERILTLLIQHHRDALTDDSPAFFEVLSKPSAGGELGDGRAFILSILARHLPLPYKLRAVDAWGKFFPWNDALLLFRLDAWREAKHPDLPLAEKDFKDYLKQNNLREEDLRNAVQASAAGSPTQAGDEQR